MAFSLVGNWDSVTPPAIPANWNNDAGMVTSAAQFFSSPNSLVLSSGTAGTKYYATSGIADPGAGATFDLTGMVYVTSSATVGLYKVGPTMRCSAATMDNSTTSAYWVNLAYNNAFTGAHLQFDKIVNGTVTTLASVTNSDSSLIQGSWYAIRVVTYGLNIFNVTLTRMSDGYTMDSSGAFQPTSVNVISSLTASDITSGGYYGFAAQANNTSSRVFMDDLLVNASGAIVLPPRRPVVVPIPFQYYHPD
ncbi:MAG: hypothetical protein P4L67_04845 [Candidatus Pacebacteria bacterium]|nr:hypothetical protein [Candidatus Paceibacterota bacterium]